MKIMTFKVGDCELHISLDHVCAVMVDGEDEDGDSTVTLYMSSGDDAFDVECKRPQVEEILEYFYRNQRDGVLVEDLCVRAGLGDGNLDVLVKRGGTWYRAIRTHDHGLEGLLQHFTTPKGVREAPVDEQFAKAADEREETSERVRWIRQRVRDQIIGAISDDLEGGESLMKECFEDLENDYEMAACFAEMKRIIKRIADAPTETPP